MGRNDICGAATTRVASNIYTTIEIYDDYSATGSSVSTFQVHAVVPSD